MHSVIYRTELLRDCGLKLPEHTFYVDNIFVYVPLPHVKTIYYLDVDMYRYFIGREDQSVNEKVMYSRRDQQLRVTRIMIDLVHLPDDVESKKLERYMENYLSMMMCICSVFLRLEKTDDNERRSRAIWKYLEDTNPVLYKRIRHTVLNWGSNIPTEMGRRFALSAYHIRSACFSSTSALLALFTTRKLCSGSKDAAFRFGQGIRNRDFGFRAQVLVVGWVFRGRSGGVVFDL